MSDPMIGDHLVSNRGYYTHHGLYAGDGQVVHYAGLSNGWQHGQIENVSFKEFQVGQSFSVRRYNKRQFTREESVARAGRRIGEDCYCLMANNCEHFVRWCIAGDHKSSQVERGAYVATSAIIGVGGVGAIVGVAQAGVVVGLSGSGIMSGLAAIGGVIGGGAVAGLGFASAIPGAASVLLINRTLLRDNPGLESHERDARQVGRIATSVGAAGGTAGGLIAVSALGSVVGFSAAGITSGLAAIGSATGVGAALSAIGVGGGMMMGGAAVAVAAPALLAAAAGYGAYRGVRWLRWQPEKVQSPTLPDITTERKRLSVNSSPGGALAKWYSLDQQFPSEPGYAVLIRFSPLAYPPTLLLLSTSLSCGTQMIFSSWPLSSSIRNMLMERQRMTAPGTIGASARTRASAVGGPNSRPLIRHP